MSHFPQALYSQPQAVSASPAHYICMATLDEGIITLSPLERVYSLTRGKTLPDIHMVAQTQHPYRFSNQQLEMLYRGHRLEVELPLKPGEVVLGFEQDMAREPQPTWKPPADPTLPF